MPGQWRNQPGDPLGMPLSADGRLHGWGIPWILETTQTVPVPTPVPYAVPYPYPVPARAEPVRPAPPPYDPTKARMRIIGSGTDGGGGVMRVEHLAGDSLRVTWLGTPRPIREARLFLADESYQPLRTRTIDAQHREARFRTTGMARTARYAGSTVVFADGSEHTMLVPLASRPVAPVPATR